MFETGKAGDLQDPMALLADVDQLAAVLWWEIKVCLKVLV